MINWKNLKVNPPRNNDYFLFRVESKEVDKYGNPKVGYLHGCFQPLKEEFEGNLGEYLFIAESIFPISKENSYRIHKIDFEKYDYKYLNLREIH